VRRKAPKKVYKVTQPVKPGAIERHQDRRNLMVLVKNLELGFQRATQLKNLTQSALDEAEGPDAAYIEVPDQGLADDRVFANRSAGDFVRHMIGLVETKDEMIKNLRQQGAETERLKREVRDYQLNLETTGQNDLISAQPAHRRQLLNMINKWLDVRVRAMYTFARDHNLINNAQIPQAMGDRISLLNTLVHGGDLYSDVLINYLNHMTSRHDAPTQQEMKRWYETVLPQIYGGLTLEPAGWIRKYSKTVLSFFLGHDKLSMANPISNCSYTLQLTRQTRSSTLETRAGSRRLISSTSTSRSWTPR
jgi:hypothetical protein